jgi:hypothetical protein
VTDSDNTAPMLLLVDGHRVAVWRFGRRGEWHHGGLIVGWMPKWSNDVGRQCDADIISIDRRGIGRGEYWPMASMLSWPKPSNGSLSFSI